MEWKLTITQNLLNYGVTLLNQKFDLQVSDFCIFHFENRIRQCLDVTSWTLAGVVNSKSTKFKQC